MVCKAIHKLIMDEKERIESTFVNHITPEVKSKLTRLIGEKCMVKCNLNNKPDFGL